MREVWFAGGAELSFVLLCGKDISASYEIQVVTGMVLLDLCQNVLESNHQV